MEVILVKAQQTAWAQEDRLQGNLEVPLSAEGITGAKALAGELVGYGGRHIFTGFTLCCYQTARILSEMNGRVGVSRREDLNEVNLGLWQGLLIMDLKRKHRRSFLRWLRSPVSVNPPMGERLTDAFERLKGGLEDILKTNRRRKIIVVAGPYAYTLLHCYLSDRPLENFWSIYKSPKKWEFFNL
jgi:broad specificity phosphatase PhoE